MFANPQSFGLVRSTSSLALFLEPLEDRSRGASTVDKVARQEEFQPLRRIVPSAGSLVVHYAKDLVATASAHTILDFWKLPIFIGENPYDDEDLYITQPGILSIPEVLRGIEELTVWSRTRIAEEIFDKSRTAYYDWLEGKSVALPNEQRIRGTRDVLQRASTRYGSPERLQGWLTTPVGSHAVSPLELLKAGEIDKARLLALSNLPQRETALPEWLLDAPLDSWSAGEQRRRRFVVRESDATERTLEGE